MGRYFRLQSITMDTKLNCPIVPRTLPPPKPSRNTETFCLQTPSPLAIVGANTRIENKIDAAARARKIVRSASSRPRTGPKIQIVPPRRHRTRAAIITALITVKT
jgi:hypothetical protein